MESFRRFWENKEFRKNLPWSIAWVSPTRPIFSYLFKRALALGWVWPFIYSAGAAFFTVFNGYDPLMWRSFSNEDWLMQRLHSIQSTWAGFSNHHFLNLVVVSIVSFGLAFYFARNSVGGSFLKRFYSFGLLASLGSVWVWSVHEGMWWIVYAWKYYEIIHPIWFSGFGEYFVVGFLIMTASLGLFFPWKYTGLMAAFYVAWIAAGFPITETYLGNSPMYYSLAANAWEVGSWVFAAGAFYIFERKKLLDWYTGIKEIISKGQTY